LRDRQAGRKNYSGLRGSLRYNPNDKIDWVVTGDYTYETAPMRPAC
jgi:cytochrome c-type biogenesis protein CcmH/NrfG